MMLSYSFFPSLLSGIHVVLQIRRVKRDILGIYSHISPYKIFSVPSLELFCQDSSNEGSQHMISLRNKKNYL